MITVTTSDGEDQYSNATRYIATDHDAIIVFRGAVWIAFYPPGMFSKVVQTDEPVAPTVEQCGARGVEQGLGDALPLRCISFRDHSGPHLWCDG